MRNLLVALGDDMSIRSLSRLGVSIAAVLAFSSPAFAVSPKTNSPYDYRIKTVVYNAADTVQLNAVTGIQIHIKVAPGEKYVTHAFGDDAAWEFSHKLNHFFIRPKAELSDTNLTIVTDRRVYNILLHFIGSYKKKDADGKVVDAFIANPWSMKQATVELNYRYPMDDAAATDQQRNDQRIKDALARADRQSPKNLSYERSNEPAAQDIAPVNTWDDYRFTYFKFPANAELPTLFVIGADGKESTVNTHIEGPDHNIIAAQMVAREWRVRSGDKVVGVRNDAFDPSLGGNPSGVVVPGVSRVLKTNDNGSDE
jgi:type IV secretion system protein VirB9